MGAPFFSFLEESRARCVHYSAGKGVTRLAGTGNLLPPSGLEEFEQMATQPMMENMHFFKNNSLAVICCPTPLSQLYAFTM